VVNSFFLQCTVLKSGYFGSVNTSIPSDWQVEIILPGRLDPTMTVRLKSPNLSKHFRSPHNQHTHVWLEAILQRFQHACILGHKERVVNEYIELVGHVYLLMWVLMGIVFAP